VHPIRCENVHVIAQQDVVVTAEIAVCALRQVTPDVTDLTRIPATTSAEGLSREFQLYARYSEDSSEDLKDNRASDLLQSSAAHLTAEVCVILEYKAPRHFARSLVTR
jgi:hypothetical protein